MRSRWSVVLVVLVTALLCAGQQKGRDDALPMPMPRLNGPWEAVAQKSPQAKIDPAQMKTQADELAKLATGIPQDVAQIQRGLLAKDLKARLARIQKLSRQLAHEVDGLR